MRKKPYLQFAETAARELALFAMNDADLYRQRITPIIKNLQRKMKKGIYDPDKAVKLWRYAADDAAKRYKREYGGTFDVPTRQRVAEMLAAHYDEHIDDLVTALPNPATAARLQSIHYGKPMTRKKRIRRAPIRRRHTRAKPPARSRRILPRVRPRRAPVRRRRTRVSAPPQFGSLPVLVQLQGDKGWATVAAFRGDAVGIKRAKAYCRKISRHERLPGRVVRR